GAATGGQCLRQGLQASLDLAGSADLVVGESQRLLALLQPVAGGLHPAVMRKMIAGLVSEVMGFVENINGVFRRWQYRPATQGQISQYQIVVGDDAIHTVDLLTGFEKAAAGNKRTAATTAL